MTTQDRPDEDKAVGPADGVALIAAERRRQIEQEGWTPEHDDQHRQGELGYAAACYAVPPAWALRSLLLQEGAPSWWKPAGDSPDGRIRDLEKAGALIAAEIDRLLRARGTK